MGCIQMDSLVAMGLAELLFQRRTYLGNMVVNLHEILISTAIETLPHHGGDGFQAFAADTLLISKAHAAPGLCRFSASYADFLAHNSVSLLFTPETEPDFSL